MTFAGSVCNNKIEIVHYDYVDVSHKFKGNVTIPLMCLNSRTLLCNHVNKVDLQLC